MLRPLGPGDVVLKHIAYATSVGKLESKQESPYIITHMTRVGVYYIATMDGDPMGHT